MAKRVAKLSSILICCYPLRLQKCLVVTINHLHFGKEMGDQVLQDLAFSSPGLQVLIKGKVMVDATLMALNP